MKYRFNSFFISSDAIFLIALYETQVIRYENTFKNEQLSIFSIEQAIYQLRDILANYTTITHSNQETIDRIEQLKRDMHEPAVTILCHQIQSYIYYKKIKPKTAIKTFKHLFDAILDKIDTNNHELNQYLKNDHASLAKECMQIQRGHFHSAQ